MRCGSRFAATRDDGHTADSNRRADPSHDADSNRAAPIRPIDAFTRELRPPSSWRTLLGSRRARTLRLAVLAGFWQPPKSGMSARHVTTCRAKRAVPRSEHCEQ